MKKIIVGALAAALLAQAPSAARAQDIDAMHEVHVKRAIAMALKQIHRALCAEGVRCEPATDAELDNPPIPIAEARRIIKTGVASGAAQWCKVDWRQRIFLPMMARLRDGEKWSERQLAIAALMHGIYQGQTAGPLAARGECPAEMRANLEQNPAPK